MGRRRGGRPLRFLGSLSNAHRVGSVIRPGAGQQESTALDGRLHLSYQLIFLRLMGGGRFTGGARNQDRITALLDEVIGQSDGGINIQRSVLMERSHHRDGNRAKDARRKHRGFSHR